MNPESSKVSGEIVSKVEDILQAEYSKNKEFNETLNALNGDDAVTVPSLRRDRPEGHKLDASEVLFWTDREAYNDELLAWENATIHGAHRATINLINDTKQNAVFNDLVAAITRNRIVPFIGAGMSQSCKLPLWREALDEMAARIPQLDKTAFAAAVSAFNYTDAAQLLWSVDDTQVRNYIRNRFDKSIATKEKIRGAVLLLPRISKGCVITTNFDNVVETVMGSFDGYMHGMQPGNKFVPKLMKGDRCLLKLHGDAEDPRTYVFTGQQYVDGYGSPFNFSKPLPRALRQIYISQSLLFLGCSLEQDKTLELFSHVKSEGQSKGENFDIPDHFAILPEPSDAALRNQKEARLSAMDIRTLWYPKDNREFVEGVLQLAIATIDGRIKSF